ncbi:MAG: succinate dehydrogenase assembly factor 2 [Oceanococcus sp.]
MNEFPISRLKWQCRRGMKELDVLMEQYLATRYPQAPEAEQQAFRDVLAMDDPDIYSICVKRMPPPEHLKIIFDQLQVPQR